MKERCTEEKYKRRVTTPQTFAGNAASDSSFDIERLEIKCFSIFVSDNTGEGAR